MKHIPLIFKILVPLAFFIVAVTEGKAYWLAGLMVIITLTYYVFDHVGAFKPKISQNGTKKN